MDKSMDVDLGQCLRGDKAAWDGLVAAYAGLIYATVARTLRSGGTRQYREQIDDTVQEVFLRLVKDDFRLLRTFDPRRAGLSTFLTVVARSAALDGLRKTRPAPASLDEAIWQVPAGDDADPAKARGPEASALANLPADLLSPRQELVLALLFDRGMDVPQIAQFLAIEEQTVRSTKHKALEKLRQALQAPELPDTKK
jgi:RNA polymerase sigma-70 factor (ECF subfamily)